jgi:hypothetical protein
LAKSSVRAHEGHGRHDRGVDDEKGLYASSPHVHTEAAFTCPSPKLYSARYVRIEFEGDTEWAPALSTAALVKPRASLGTPVAPATMDHTTTYTVYGTLLPLHAAGSNVGTLYCYRLESGSWVLRKTFGLTAYVSSGQSRYRTTAACLPYAGSWRMRAYHSDAGNAPTYSGWRYVTVK